MSHAELKQLRRRCWVSSSLLVVPSEFFGVLLDGWHDGFGHLCKKRSGDLCELVSHRDGCCRGFSKNWDGIFVEVVDDVGILGKLVKAHGSHGLQVGVVGHHACPVDSLRSCRGTILTAVGGGEGEGQAGGEHQNGGGILQKRVWFTKNIQN